MTKTQAIKALRQLGFRDIVPDGRFRIWATGPDGHRGLYDPRDLLAEVMPPADHPSEGG